ncbi:MAG: hypothetical protein H6Q90_3091 [Deltaproteobacteria bacterium]|nr:hypothetical protein [Deltaproteobacteria bacterium]
MQPHRLVALVIALGFAGCGGRPRADQPPRPSDPKQLALALHLDLERLGELAHRLRGRCPELVAELRPHVARMRAHAAEVKQATQDRKLAIELKSEVLAYDERDRGLSDVIGTDLGASYLSCKQATELRALIDQIPSL